MQRKERNGGKLLVMRNIKKGVSSPRHPRQRDFCKKVDAAVAPDWSAAKGDIPLKGDLVDITLYCI